MLIDSTLKNILIVILAAVLLPFAVVIIEKTLFPYPVIVEETTKLLIVFFAIFNLRSLRKRILVGFLFGFLFGLSESIFYLVNIIDSGDIGIFLQRFLFTIPMHISTVLVMVLSGIWRKWMLIFGFAGAIALHALFNSYQLI